MPVLTEPAWAVVAVAFIVAARDVLLAWVASKAAKSLTNPLRANRDNIGSDSKNTD